MDEKKGQTSTSLAMMIWHVVSLTNTLYVQNIGWVLVGHEPLVRLDASRGMKGTAEENGFLTYSPDGRFLAIATADAHSSPERSHVKVWYTASWEEVGGKPLLQNYGCVASLAFTHDSKWLLSGDIYGEIRI